MSEEIKANKDCQILVDDDVVSLNASSITNTLGTFTVKQLKELLGNQFMANVVSMTNRGSYYMKPEFSNISVGSEVFECKELGLIWTHASCKYLKISSGKWQEGELRVYVNIIKPEFYSNGQPCDRYMISDSSHVEFCLDRPPEPTPSLETASPLDEIRQSEEYKKAGQQ